MGPPALSQRGVPRKVFRLTIASCLVLVLSLCILSRAETPPQHQIPPLRGKLNMKPRGLVGTWQQSAINRNCSARMAEPEHG